MGPKGNYLVGIPDHKLSSQVLPGRFLVPDNLANHALTDYELGGIALNDPSEGLQVQTWTAWLQGDDVVVTAPSYGSDPPTVLFGLTDVGALAITEISLAFDQNMNPFIAYVKDGEAWFWWYDEGIPGTVHTQLPVGSVTPRCCMDDKRELMTASNDILLAYIEGNALKYREQRDRFLIAYTLQTDVDATIIRLGMSNVNRVQFLMRSNLQEQACR